MSEISTGSQRTSRPAPRRPGFLRIIVFVAIAAFFAYEGYYALAALAGAITAIMAWVQYSSTARS
ncbi:MAG: hypothetical protein JNJ88_10280 [Planctomycetes bacterium]|nr:hypothetical protein [Planctomycetota bacterium]